jgi:NADPH:quinone reductase-like Zn-dependent oxidoreductase
MLRIEKKADVEFKPAGKLVMVEAVPKDLGGLVLPDSVQGAECDVLVRAIGPEVTKFAVGDSVLCLPKDGKPMRFNAGDGFKLYIFYAEDAVLGKFEIGNAEKLK